MAKTEANVTIYGRLSYPTFSYAQAVIRNQKSEYPKSDVSQVTPDFNLLVEPEQLNKLKRHILDVFIPYCIAQAKAGEKKNALSEKDAARIIALIEAEDWEGQPPHIPIKVVPEKTAALAPETVAMVKILGNRGVDIIQKAIINSEEELAVPTGEEITSPEIRPIAQTVHTLYGGCYAAATLNLYAYLSGKMPGITASAGVVIFKADGESFAGGIAVDEDEIFLD